mmetsp:Transcript_86453/g.201130  ORF Transcript_86453/g.201130 Transcript_86453/m.201130 type:complete len:412 (+) Transcript_86453:60-1295(+)
MDGEDNSNGYPTKAPSSESPCYKAGPKGGMFAHGFMPVHVAEEMDATSDKFVVESDGTVVEHWEFETDAYSIGLLAMTTKGLPRGTFELILALATPTIQLLAFFRILGHLLDRPRGWDGNYVETPRNTTVQCICFLLIAMQVSNEALEGLHKLIFSFRAFGGKYKDVKKTACLGIIFGFMQCIMAVCTVGLSMLVVSEQQTALDAFMNFVAVAFLTEVDNILVAARTVTSFVSLDTTITVQHAYTMDCAECKQSHWPTMALVVVNVLVLFSVAMSVRCFNTAAQSDSESQGINWFGQVPWAILGLLALNTAMWIGKRVSATSKYFMGVGYCSLTVCAIDMVYLYITHSRLLPVLLTQAAFAFSLAAPTCAGAIVFNPFPFMFCPISSPCLVWAMLLYSVFCFSAMSQFGVH